MQTINLQHSSEDDDMEHIEVVEDVTLDPGGTSPVANPDDNEPALHRGSAANSVNTNTLPHKEDKNDHSNDVRQAGLQVECEDNLAEASTDLPTTPLVSKRRLNRTSTNKFECDVCPMRCRNSYMLELHKCTHSQDRPYSCNNCDDSFKHPSHLRRHEKKHRDKDHEVASQNGEDIDMLSGSQASMSECEDVPSLSDKSTLGKMWTCIFCKRDFPSQHSLLRHERNHTNPLACQVCDKVLASAAAFQLHKNTHSGDLPYGCNLCDLKFRRKTQLDQHNEAYHQLVPGLENDGSHHLLPQRRAYTHDVSARHTPSRIIDDDVLTEMDTTFDIEQSVEDVPSALDSAIDSQREMTPGAGNPSKKKAYICNTCQKGLSSKSSLVSHMRLHTGERIHKCDECAIDFAHKSELMNHSIDIHGKPPTACIYSCEKCPFQSKSEYALKRHLQTHTNARTAKCEHCGLYFKDNVGLKRHITVKHKALRSPVDPISRPQQFRLSGVATTLRTERPPSLGGEINNAHRSVLVITECFGKTSSQILPVLWIEEFDRAAIGTVDKQTNTYVVCIRTLNLEDKPVRECLASMSGCDAAVNKLDHNGTQESIYMFLFRGGKFNSELRGRKFESYKQLSRVLGQYAASVQKVPVNILPGNSGVWYRMLLTELEGSITIAASC